MKSMNTKVNQRLGKLLKAKRISMGLSLPELAKGSNLSFEFVAKVEQGKGWLNLDDLVMLNKALKISLADLFKEAGL